MMLTDFDWLRILLACGVKDATADDWAPSFTIEWQPSFFSAGMDDIKALLPEVLHETTGHGKAGYGPLERLQEDLSYTPERMHEVWPSHFPTISSAVPYAHSPTKLGNFIYANRMGNGDVATGDGYRFRGMGPPMLTGRAAYRHAGELCGLELETSPELILDKRTGLAITRHWWEGNIPDSMLSDQVKMRRKVQGGSEGLPHVQALAKLVQQVLA